MAKVTGKDGIVKIGSAVNIADATHSAGVVTVETSAAHGLTANTRIVIAGAGGMTDLNDHFTIATVPSGTFFTIALSTAQTFTTGGTVQEIIEVTAWNLTSEAVAMNTTDSDSGDWQEMTPKGMTSFSGSIEGFMYSSTRKPTKGSELVADLQTNGTDDFSGTIILTSDLTELEISGETAVQATFNFIGTGALA